MSKKLILGSNGQLGKALQVKYPDAICTDINELDITDKKSVDDFDWSDIETVFNAAAYTNVDGAESGEGRTTAWLVNATAVSNLVSVCDQYSITLVHISSDYVFDGNKSPHLEDEAFSPLSVYGASKAAGDLLAQQLKKHYILRASWVIGEGNNFVRTMINLAQKDISPTVVSDQVGRLTFTSELVRAIDFLISNKVDYGTYNVTNAGKAVSWSEITREIFKTLDRNDLTVTDISTKEYFANKDNVAPRPLKSEMSLSKLRSTGFVSQDWRDDLLDYINKETR